VDSKKFPFVILAFLAFVAVVPAWTYFTNDYTTLRPEDSWLASLVLPTAAALFIVSWVKPELTGLVLGGFVIAALMMLAPWWFRFIDMVSGQLTQDPLAQVLLELAIPIAILLFVATAGARRLGIGRP